MSAQPQATSIPAVEIVLGETIAGLAVAAHAYLTPAEESASPDLGGAEILIDVAGAAFDRIAPRLPSEERSALARLLTDLRMTYVQKRGL
jgi:hypothetical protein